MSDVVPTEFVFDISEIVDHLTARRVEAYELSNSFLGLYLWVLSSLGILYIFKEVHNVDRAYISHINNRYLFHEKGNPVVIVRSGHSPLFAPLQKDFELVFDFRSSPETL